VASDSIDSQKQNFSEEEGNSGSEGNTGGEGGSGIDFNAYGICSLDFGGAFASENGSDLFFVNHSDGGFHAGTEASIFSSGGVIEINTCLVATLICLTTGLNNLNSNDTVDSCVTTTFSNFSVIGGSKRGKIRVSDSFDYGVICNFFFGTDGDESNGNSKGFHLLV
jgi:hypothetical protein